MDDRWISTKRSIIIRIITRLLTEQRAFNYRRDPFDTPLYCSYTTSPRGPRNECRQPNWPLKSDRGTRIRRQNGFSKTSLRTVRLFRLFEAVQTTDRNGCQIDFGFASNTSARVYDKNRNVGTRTILTRRPPSPLVVSRTRTLPVFFTRPFISPKHACV